MNAYLPKLGNIKIGGVKQGKPVQYQHIYITDNSKRGNENFVLHKDFPHPLSNVDIILPYGINSFEYGEIAFVIISGHSYLVKKRGDYLYLIPLDPCESNDSIWCKTIRMDISHPLAGNIELQQRAILYALPVGYPYIGAFHFKTSSKYSIAEIKNAIYIASVCNQNLLTSVFSLEVHTKMLSPDGNEVSYVRLVPKIILDEEQMHQIKQIASILSPISNKIIQSRSEAVDRSIEISDFIAALGGQIEIIQEKDDAGDIFFSHSKQTTQPKKEESSSFAERFASKIKTKNTQNQHSRKDNQKDMNGEMVLQQETNDDKKIHDLITTDSKNVEDNVEYKEQKKHNCTETDAKEEAGKNDSVVKTNEKKESKSLVDNKAEDAQAIEKPKKKRRRKNRSSESAFSLPIFDEEDIDEKDAHSSNDNTSLNKEEIKDETGTLPVEPAATAINSDNMKDAINAMYAKYKVPVKLLENLANYITDVKEYIKYIESVKGDVMSIVVKISEFVDNNETNS